MTGHFLILDAGTGSGRAVIGASGATIAGVVPQAVLALLARMPNASVELVEAPMRSKP